MESKEYLQVCVIWVKIWTALSEVQFPLEFGLYGNLGQFYAIMEGQIKVFLLAPRKKCLLGKEAGKFFFMKLFFLCLSLFLGTAEILSTRLNLFSSSMCGIHLIE